MFLKGKRWRSVCSCVVAPYGGIFCCELLFSVNLVGKSDFFKKFDVLAKTGQFLAYIEGNSFGETFYMGNTTVYKQRRPEQTAPYKIIKSHYDSFKEVYENKYQKQYGFFRPIIDEVVGRYKKCGILKHGFARIRCDSCKTEYLLAFSCKSRICPSCMAKHMLNFQNFFLDRIVQKIPHRHIVFTIPKVLRRYFIMNRKSLNDLSRIANTALKEFFSNTLKCDGKAGTVMIIQTHGNYLNANPHIHCITTDGLYLDNGMFHVMPKYNSTSKKYLQKLFESKVARYSIKKGFIREETIKQRLSWRYSGFSVYVDTPIDYTIYNEHEKEKMSQILRYVSKPFYSMNRVIFKEEGKNVLYKGEYNPVLKKNFEVYSYTDFIAAVTSHIPNRYQKYINYYGWYSSKCRGMREKVEKVLETIQDIEEAVTTPTVSQKAYKKSWARLIKQVWEVDPLECPLCGNEMRVVSIIKDDIIVEKILRHVGEWDDNTDTRGSPIHMVTESTESIDQKDEIVSIPFYDDFSTEDALYEEASVYSA